MARKTKTQKGGEENKASEVVESAENASVDAKETQPESESALTEELSEPSDISGDDPVESQTLTEAEPNEVSEEVSASETDPTDNNGAAEDSIIDAELVEEGGETGDQASQDDVPTAIAGVVPAATEAPASSDVQPQSVPANGKGAFPLIFGGVAAGAIGFLAATFAPGAMPPDTTSAPTPDAETVARIDALSGEIIALSERLEAMQSTAGDAEDVDLRPLTTRLDVLESESSILGEALAALEQSIVDLGAEVTAVGERPAIVTPDGSAAMEAQLEAFRNELDAVTASARAEIEEAQARASMIEADAAAAAAEAQRNAAIAELRAALESGTPFAGSIGVLGEVPEALTVVADTGVMPLADLQDSFPDVARSVLQIAEGAPENASTTDRLAAFLRRQTNARSLAPREGDDVDAILSRSEAALTDGDLDGALAELATLPDDAASVMQNWISAAQSRAAAVSALNDLN